MGCAASFQSGSCTAGDELNAESLETSAFMSMKWRQVPTTEEAKAKFIADQTLKEGDISDVKIELRALLEDPIAQHALGHYAGEQANSTGELYSSYFMCWCDIQEFKAIPSESYRWSKALHIFHKYIKSTAVLKLKVLSAAQREEYKSLIDNARNNDNFLNESFYNELQYQCFLQILEHLFIPFKSTPKYVKLQTHLQKKYNRVKLSHFVYYDVIGEGGFGLVLHCKKKSTGKHYAMKLQTKCGMLRHYKNNPEKVNTERMAFASCQHPFIVNLDYAFQTDALAILVLDLATGGDLAQCIKDSPQRRLDEKRIQFYAAEVVLALSYLHQMKLVYRDLKPQNILLREDGHIQLADLGGILDQTEKNELICGSHKAALPLLMTSMYRPTTRHRSVHKDGYSIHSAGSKSFRSMHSKSSTPRNHLCAADNREERISMEASNNASFSFNAAPVKERTDIPKETEVSENVVDGTGEDGFEKVAEDDKNEQPGVPRRRMSVMGTMGYMAPEMVLLFGKTKKMFGEDAFGQVEKDMENTKKLRKRLYNHAVDYWSLGVTIYVMFCGYRPFNDCTYNGIIDLDSTMRGALQENLSFKEYTMLFRKIEFPQHMGKDARNLVTRLLDVNPETRIGCGSHGASDIKRHPFFNGIDWTLLEQRHVEPPYKPASTFLDHYDEEDAYPDFETLMEDNGKQDWIMEIPDEEGQKHFSNWNFTSANTIRIESGLAHAMDQYDRNFKVRQLMGAIDVAPPSNKGHEQTRPAEGITRSAPVR